MNTFSADGNCEEFGGHLVAIESADENALIGEIANDTCMFYAFIPYTCTSYL